MRTSQAGLAIIQQGESWLLQWDSGWQAYSLIGGHVEANETFRECALRETSEELACDPSAIYVDTLPCATLKFRGFSNSKQEETEYHWQVFFACVDQSTLDRLTPDCTWVTQAQIGAQVAADGKPIAEQVWRVFKSVTPGPPVISMVEQFILDEIREDCERDERNQQNE